MDDASHFPHPCSPFLARVRHSDLGPDRLGHDLRREQTENLLALFISVKPAHSTVVHLQVVLAVPVGRVTAHCIENRLDAPVGFQFDPGRYGDRLTRDVLEVLTVEKNVSAWGEGSVKLI